MHTEGQQKHPGMQKSLYYISFSRGQKALASPPSTTFCLCPGSWALRTNSLHQVTHGLRVYSNPKLRSSSSSASWCFSVKVTPHLLSLGRSQHPAPKAHQYLSLPVRTHFLGPGHTANEVHGLPLSLMNWRGAYKDSRDGCGGQVEGWWRHHEEQDNALVMCVFCRTGRLLLALGRRGLTFPPFAQHKTWKN